MSITKARVFFYIGLLLTIAAILFVIFALRHPESSWPLPGNITYKLYTIYFIITVCMYLFAVVLKRRH